MSRRRVCLVTTGHPSTNPRLVKEADALASAGYDVAIVACSFWRWAEAADVVFEGRPWSVKKVHFGEMASGASSRWLRLRHRLAREAVACIGSERAPDALLSRAIHYVTPELARLAAATPADLYIAHNLGALPAAAAAAQRHGARLGFDAEDFHLGELPVTTETTAQRALVAAVETRFLPRCTFVTAASDGISHAYANETGIPFPTTILNVFPLTDRDTPVDASALVDEVPGRARSLHWFSQTIGPGRGLEDAVASLPFLPEDVVLSLRGGWAPGYERELRCFAESLGVSARVRALAHCPPDEVVRRTAAHDIGLALEPARTENNDLAASNKLFTYLLAGLPTVATATTGQSGICARAPEATRLVAPGNPEALAHAVADLLSNPSARAAAEQAGREQFNWDAEQSIFLNVVSDALAGISKPKARMLST